MTIRTNLYAFMKYAVSLLILLFVSCSHSQDAADTAVTDKVQHGNVLDSLGIDHEVARNSKYRFQMVYTPIIDGKMGGTYSYNTDAYYYPASLVKFLTAAVLLEELHENNVPLDCSLEIDAVNTCGSTRFIDLSKKKISFQQMLTELMVVSDNNFYNLLYHFVTPSVLNLTLAEKGARNTKIYRAFAGCDVNENLHTYPTRVLNALGKTIYEKPEQVIDTNYLSELYTHTDDRMFGSRHENAAGAIVSGPFDLNYHIEIPLEEIHHMFAKLLIPEAFATEEQWNMSDNDRAFLLNLMGLYTNEVTSAYRTLSHLRPNEYKYATPFPGDQTVRTISKLGLSYGFASEITYIEIPGTEDAMILSYSVYVNENDVVNDGDYEYESVARPFAEDLVNDLIKWQKSNR